MSYARWSSMNWMSDVYVYEDVSGGWTTHVAARRRGIGPIPDLLPWAGTSLSKWGGGKWDQEKRRVVYASRFKELVCYTFFWFAAFWHTHVHMRSLRMIPLRDIGLPFDGETFNDPTPGDCARRLEWLRQMGYNVPKLAIAALRDEGINSDASPDPLPTHGSTCSGEHEDPGALKSSPGP